MIRIDHVAPTPAQPGSLRVTFQCAAAEAVETPIDFEHVYVFVKEGQRLVLDLPERDTLRAGESVRLHDIAYACIHQYQADWVWARDELPPGTPLRPGLAPR